MPEYLLAKYPEEMTIVLQHQYWDLEIADEYFEVTVSFNKLQERIHVPFKALSAFVDPSVRFGLQFDHKDKAAADRSVEKGPGAVPTQLPVVDKRPQLPVTTAVETKPDGNAAVDGASGVEPGAEAKPEDAASKVVKLDSFRKK
jgi:uncharacterized protein